MEENGQRKRILNDVSLTIDERFVAITGPNGSGKSTLAKIIAGILTPTGGKLLFNGKGHHASFRHRARKAGHLVCLPAARALQGHHGKKTSSRSRAGKHITVGEACGYLSEVGLCARDYIDREVNASLSGGELKRIEIATVLARGTSLSVFDEPEAGIDLWSFQNLISVVRKNVCKVAGEHRHHLSSGAHLEHCR